MVEIQDTKVLFLAIWLHETYEAQAREVGWKTQESCRVKFDELPEANKKVMLKIAKDICYNLELNKQEGRVESEKEIVDLIVKQQKVYRNNLDKGESKWLEGAVDCCNYLLQLIKEKRLGELKGE